MCVIVSMAPFPFRHFDDVARKYPMIIGDFILPVMCCLQKHAIVSLSTWHSRYEIVGVNMTTT